ncbi:polyphosphate kinase [Candidatus Kinetoplastibacterium desouzaii TCC079E]|uniref:Polyphosphate kinase n=1 Tax=Candidatus Kinetoplastidibacterium desouzai TCC079E TaxID=1208919 RepID=M1M363_9PROT|nr:polyphosphate kinase 1 [Candidatus Kinetoplastibacterium desouzaii]AGF46705.1 polyphosphate kinase [Candidatus Kinetoplastibacterium desouzaii TCC079E]
MVKHFSKDSLFLNRDLSFLSFNERVLDIAEKSNIPLLERLRYICIVSLNLDEFFEIRVASLKEQRRLQPDLESKDGLILFEDFYKIQAFTHSIVNRQYDLLNNSIIPELLSNHIFISNESEWDESQFEWARSFFTKDVMPLLTPIGLDPAHPFPMVYNKSLNFIVSLSGVDAFGRQASIAVVQTPRTLPKLIRMPLELSKNRYSYVLLTTLLKAFVGDLFPGLVIKGCYQWRVTRNSNLFVDEEEVSNLRLALQGELSQRHFGAAVRLEIDEFIPNSLECFLQKEFSLSDYDIYKVNGPINLSRFMQICDSKELHHLSFKPYYPSIPTPFRSSKDKPSILFDFLKKQDILLHHPYQSFQPVIDFLTAASLDPDVVAIKQTIYRTGEDSELMKILLLAAKNGKEVTVVVELMARFDEQTNINWASKLEEVGAHVVYGVVSYKTHAKMALVLRREKGVLKRYVHLSTGNYHTRTSNLYTDFGVLTSDFSLSEDIDKIFSQLTGLGARLSMKSMLYSPFTLHEAMISMIRKETDISLKGKKSRIIAKMNSLLEPEIIKELYIASESGVQIDLIVRGVCALRAGVPGLSENIRVRSILGRFLEHSRVFYFYSDGEEKLFLSSADWMGRNFFRRVEIAFPIVNESIKKRIFEEAFTYALRDNQFAWDQYDGKYIKHINDNTELDFSSQNYLMDIFKS